MKHESIGGITSLLAATGFAGLRFPDVEYEPLLLFRRASEGTQHNFNHTCVPHVKRFISRYSAVSTESKDTRTIESYNYCFIPPSCLLPFLRRWHSLVVLYQGGPPSRLRLRIAKALRALQPLLYVVIASSSSLMSSSMNLFSVFTISWATCQTTSFRYLVSTIRRNFGIHIWSETSTQRLCKEGLSLIDRALSDHRPKYDSALVLLPPMSIRTPKSVLS
jgi:hypothetical protein